MGKAPTVIVILALAVHEFPLPTTTVYVVVVVGVAVESKTLVLLKPIDGLHAKMVPVPVAVSCVLCPSQIVLLPAIAAMAVPTFTVKLNGRLGQTPVSTINVIVYVPFEVNTTPILSVLAP